MRKKNPFLMLLLCLTVLYSKAQQTDSLLTGLQNIPGKYYNKIEKKYTSIEEKLTKKSVKYLEKMRRQEKKMQLKMHSVDSLASDNLFAGTETKYSELISALSKKGKDVADLPLNEYNSYLDTASTALSFLKKYSNTPGKLKLPLSSLDELKSKLNQSEKIKEFIAERKTQIQTTLAKYAKLPASLKKEYQRLGKTAYYYSAQVKEYKDMLKDPSKIEQKALGILNKLPAFQKFMKQNSQLASLFRVPDNNGSAQILTGLQTRGSVQSLIQQRISSGGPNAQTQIQANLAAAHAELNKLKDKLNGAGGGSGDLGMPNFKPNSQKTKTFLKRLEYSADVQFSKSSNLLPSGANIGLGVGYKLNDKSAIGIGANYKVGMGTIRHISFTSQGIGLRSYMDWKIKKQIYATGGYEMNYNASFKNIQQLKIYNAWQQSALIGISKKYKISNKVKGEMKVLYDFLANQHIPISQQIIFRLGYKF